MQNPPPPPPPSYGQPPPPPSGGEPPMMPPPSGGYAMGTPSNLASPGMRIVGGLIDAVILAVVGVILYLIFQKNYGPVGFISLIIDIIYFGYFWSSRGQSIGMMPFGFKVRDAATGQFPTMGKAALRGFIWTLEYDFTFCIIGAIGWLWMLWDPRKQALHDKVAGTIVTTS